MNINKRLHEILEPDNRIHRAIKKTCFASYEGYKCSCGKREAYLDQIEDHVDYCNHVPEYSHCDEIAEKMRERGLWEEFVKWVWAIEQKNHAESYPNNWPKFMEAIKKSFANTLTTPHILKTAIISWHDQKEGRG
jgi:hypothetical protein